MDPQDCRANRNKPKNWFYRLFKRRSLQDRPNTTKSETSIQARESSCDDSLCEPCTRTRNSFRRSLKKMQTRVKSCVFPQKNRSQRRLGVLPDIPATTAGGMMAPPVPPPRLPPANPPEVSPRPGESIGQHRIPTDEILSLSACYWYWGPMTTAEAEEKLKFKPDGTFLVRDSSSTSYLFSISFRSVGKTMHSRIDYNRGQYNLYGTSSEGFSTISELIEHAVLKSENGVYCWSKRGEDYEFPVRLTKPLSRYTEVRSLKHLCKFVIRQRTNINDIPKLPLPTVLYSYLLEDPYF